VRSEAVGSLQEWLIRGTLLDVPLSYSTLCKVKRSFCRRGRVLG
jgi:hypothetical protein